MYDVTCEKSFDNINHWIKIVEEVSITKRSIVSVCLTVVLILAWYLPYMYS